MSDTTNNTTARFPELENYFAWEAQRTQQELSGPRFARLFFSEGKPRQTKIIAYSNRGTNHGGESLRVLYRDRRLRRC
jgi:hypothetical protein